MIGLALTSSKIRFEAERASAQDIWMGEKLPDIDAWLYDVVRAFNAANE